MKVGDIVMQGSRVLQVRGNSKSIKKDRKMIGTVIAIRELPLKMKSSRNGDWSKLLGSKTVDVLWSNGKLSENFAENSLEIIEYEQ